MQLEIVTTTGESGEVVVSLAGELDMSTEPELSKVLRQLIDVPAGRDVTVDLGDVSFLDSSGVRALLEGNVLATRRGTRLRARNARGIVARVLYLTGVDALLGLPPKPPPGPHRR
ncbi:MAG TPA: anti-sigma factor antagonist [Micromonosporaceae bacterium]|jgi:anti-sigma B factor antagonist|nr:anti-sigma factor antagonist [Micromonosporaceae bacterium]